MLYIFDPQSKIFGAKKKKNLVPRGGGGCIFKGTSLEGGYPMYHRANNTTERERRMEEREREGKGKCRGVGFHTHHFVRKVIYYLLKRSCNFLAWYTTSGKIISAAYALCISVLCLSVSVSLSLSIRHSTNDADRARFRYTERGNVSSFRGGSHGTVCEVVFNALNNGHLRSIIQLDKVYPSLHFRDRT